MQICTDIPDSSSRKKIKKVESYYNFHEVNYLLVYTHTLSQGKMRESASFVTNDRSRRHFRSLSSSFPSRSRLDSSSGLRSRAVGAVAIGAFQEHERPSTCAWVACPSNVAAATVRWHRFSRQRENPIVSVRHHEREAFHPPNRWAILNRAALCQLSIVQCDYARHFRERRSRIG